MDKRIRYQTSLTLPDEKSPTGESYRALRTNILRTTQDKLMKAILITSSNHYEGKTTTAINLALAMSDVSGYKTLLIDSDLRFPTVHDRLGLMQSPGLTEILEGSVGLDSEIIDTEKENLKVITSGNLPQYPVELLESKRLKNLIEKLKSDFDLILVDSPPVIPYSDASVLSSQVDGVLLVVQSGRTRREDIRQVQATLQDNQARVLGIVLNKQRHFVPDRIYKRRF
jgi:capsular exopolysaccharide synthesis family protein